MPQSCTGELRLMPFVFLIGFNDRPSDSPMILPWPQICSHSLISEQLPLICRCYIGFYSLRFAPVVSFPVICFFSHSNGHSYLAGLHQHMSNFFISNFLYSSVYKGLEHTPSIFPITYNFLVSKTTVNKFGLTWMHPHASLFAVYSHYGACCS